jgi:hypothetical protein
VRNQLRVEVRDNGCGSDAEIAQVGRVSHWGPGRNARTG